MPLPRVFVTRIIPEAGLSLVLQACAAEVWQDELPPTREALLKHVRGVQGLLCLLTDRIDGEVMDAAGPGLKVISNHAVGYDNIDIPAATQRRLPVGNTPGILTDATADFAFALLMAAARRVVEGDRFVHAGKWQTWGPSLLLGADFNGATLWDVPQPFQECVDALLKKDLNGFAPADLQTHFEQAGFGDFLHS